jgi:hypothetical protein
MEAPPEPSGESPSPGPSPTASPATPESEAAIATPLSPDPPVADSREIPAPRGAGLIADVLPVDRAALEEAVNRLLDRFEDLAAPSEGQAPWLSPTLALGLAAAALEVARRRLRRKLGGRNGRLRGGLVLLGFFELPGSWTEKLP